MEEIKLATLNKKLEEYKKDDKHTVLRHALVKTPLMDVITSQDKIDETVFKFDIDIKTLPIANQKQSGRCGTGLFPSGYAASTWRFCGRSNQLGS